MRRNKVRSLVEVIIHVLCWTGVYFALKALTASNFQMVTRYGNGPTMSLNGHQLFPYPHVVLGVLLLLFYGNTFLLLPRVIQMKSRRLGIAAVTGWTSLLFVLNYCAVRLLIPPGVAPSAEQVRSRAMAGLPPPPTPYSANDWIELQGVMAAIFLSMLGIAVAFFFIKEWIRNDLRRSQAEAHQLDTENRFLRSQVNPHFFFNTLNNLFSMAQRKGNEELADSISKLSDMMRYMIYESNTDTVSLQREIAYLKDCVALNKLRYAEMEVAVRFDHPVSAVASGVFVAPMLFVPFLENAFKHGVAIGRHSVIALGISVEGKKLIFSCENTDHGPVKRLEEDKGGIGLENVKRRLELIYPGRHELMAGPGDGKYIVNLQIELA
ncbi:MAG: histidine kinase [Bacteroidetes bacterium]|nr:histidine kinase [Bacteroidota bacterium]